MDSLDSEKTANRLIRFIRSSFQREGYKKALIAVSGGVDSAVSLMLTVRALGIQHVYPVLLPYGDLGRKEMSAAREYISSLAIRTSHVHVVDIQPMVDAVALYDGSMDDPRRGNVMARMRMVVVFDLSKKMNALVVGTENRTEHLLGYYTRFGDEASDVEPLKNLYKTQVYQLARYLTIPEKILISPPTAGLWPDQTDEGEFGFTYKDVDEVLFLYFDKHRSKEEIAHIGYNRKIIERIWWWVNKGYFKDRVPLLPQ